MLIELITPLVLATAPTAIVSDQPVTYNHTTQMIAMNDIKDAAGYGTMNGTRTYDWHGKPNDSDSD